MTSENGRTGRSRRHRGQWTTSLCAGIMAIVVASSAVPVIARAADPTAAIVPFRIVADGIPEALGGASGDAARGRTLIIARDPANCVLCHAVPESAVPFAGDLGPSLGGIGARLSASQLRLRVVDSRRVNAATIMPSYYVVDGLERVASGYRGKPILSASELEDVVAYLGTLR